MAKKLPRRVQSMAKRAGKVVEAAADLDLIEGLIGKEGEGNGDGNGNGEGVPGTRKGKLPPFAYMSAWAAAVGTIIVIVLAIRLILALPFGGGEVADFSPDGAQTRSVALNVANAGVLPSAQRDVGDLRSPFPLPVTDTPIIMAVTCPDGTIQIATGDMVADTVCVRGVLVLDMPAATPTATLAAATPTATPMVTPMATPYVGVLPTTGNGKGETITLTIGEYVSGETSCAEDEIYDHVTDACIHIDRIAPR